MENNVISCLMKDRGIAKEIHWKNEITLLSFFAAVIQFFLFQTPILCSLITLSQKESARLSLLGLLSEIHFLESNIHTTFRAL